MALASTFQLWFYFTVKYTNGIELLVLRSILALLLPDVNTITPGLTDDDEVAGLLAHLYTSPPCSLLTSGLRGVLSDWCGLQKGIPISQVGPGLMTSDMDTRDANKAERCFRPRCSSMIPCPCLEQRTDIQLAQYIGSCVCCLFVCCFG